MTPGWENFAVHRPDGHVEVHCIPQQDLGLHQLWGNCACSPCEDPEDPVWIHTAFDQRESYEAGRKLH